MRTDRSLTNWPCPHATSADAVCMEFMMTALLRGDGGVCLGCGGVVSNVDEPASGEVEPRG